MLRFTSCLLFFGCLLLNTSFAQTATEIRNASNAALAAFDTPGFAVGVIKDGEVVLSEGFGTRTVGQTETVDGNTLFAIASNTKAFISTALAKLHAEGKLDLDAPVQRYLPYFQLYDEYVSSHTTVRDLLCHRVGLGTFSGDAIWYKSQKSAEEIIRQIRYLPQAYEWRGGYGYTNLMFITAGEVIRSVTGQSWDEYVKANFLTPLGMLRTQTSVTPLAQMQNVATPHITHRDNLPIEMAPWEASGAAGGIISSTNDMLLWLDAQLKEGTVNDEVIFPAAAQAETMKAHQSVGRKLTFSGTGLGWFLYTRAGKTIVTHGGGYDGMYSRVILIPELNLGIVVLSNSMTGLTSAVGSYIRDLYLGEKTDGWLGRATTREANNRKSWQRKFEHAQESKVTGTNPSIEVDDLTGNYHDPLFGDITITADEDGQLRLQFPSSPALNANLNHWHYDTWEIDWDNEHAWFDFGTLQFVLDNNRQVSSLQFYVPNDDIFFEEIEAERVHD